MTLLVCESLDDILKPKSPERMLKTLEIYLKNAETNFNSISPTGNLTDLEWIKEMRGINYLSQIDEAKEIVEKTAFSKKIDELFNNLTLKKQFITGIFYPDLLQKSYDSGYVPSLKELFKLLERVDPHKKLFAKKTKEEEFFLLFAKRICENNSDNLEIIKNKAAKHHYFPKL
jgi:hypothetical protein